MTRARSTALKQITYNLQWTVLRGCCLGQGAMAGAPQQHSQVSSQEDFTSALCLTSGPADPQHCFGAHQAWRAHGEGLGYTRPRTLRMALARGLALALQQLLQRAHVCRVWVALSPKPYAWRSRLARRSRSSKFSSVRT